MAYFSFSENEELPRRANRWTPIRTPVMLALTLQVEDRTVDAALIKRARCKAAVINVWTVNDASEAMRLSDLGVDGIIGDDPAMLIAALRHA